MNELDWIAPPIRKFTHCSNYFSEEENCKKMRWKWQFVCRPFKSVNDPITRTWRMPGQTARRDDYCV